MIFLSFINNLSANPTKWSNTLKRFFGKFPTNCLSVFDHFVRLALKGLTNASLKQAKKQNCSYELINHWRKNFVIRNSKSVMYTLLDHFSLSLLDQISTNYDTWFNRTSFAVIPQYIERFWSLYARLWKLK